MEPNELKVTRKRKTVADRLEVLDARIANYTQRVAELQAEREQVVAEAKEKAAELLRQAQA